MIAKPTGCMRVVSLNLNGIRASVEKGIFDWFNEFDADIICLQETRIDDAKWTEKFKPESYFCHLFPAQRSGYAGTAIFSKVPWRTISNGLGFDLCDTEGRFCAGEFEFNGKTITVASSYFPSGSSSDEAQARKDLFLENIQPILENWHQQQKSIVICGDVNIAHTNKDIKNWKGNLKNSGFLPHEKAWLDNLFSSGYKDGFRVKNQNDEEYSWWSNRGQAWAKNVGWRIDYHFVSDDLVDTIQQVFIYRDKRFSDHAPVVIDYLW